MISISEPEGESWSATDAAGLLEEMIGQALPPDVTEQPGGRVAQVELVGSNLRVAGMLDLGRFRRVSDKVNHQEGLVAVRDATVLRRNGRPTGMTAPRIWVALSEVSLVALPALERSTADTAQHVPKVSTMVAIVTPNHILTGTAHLAPGAELAMFIESPTPPFLPLTEVRARSLADRQAICGYDVALINRRHIVAVTELQRGMLGTVVATADDMPEDASENEESRQTSEVLLA